MPYAALYGALDCSARLGLIVCLILFSFQMLYLFDHARRGDHLFPSSSSGVAPLPPLWGLGWVGVNGALHCLSSGGSRIGWMGDVEADCGFTM